MISRRSLSLETPLTAVNIACLERMLIALRHGKGGKDRYTGLSGRLLLLREYWKAQRPQEGLCDAFQQRRFHPQLRLLPVSCSLSRPSTACVPRVSSPAQPPYFLASFSPRPPSL
jgi:hypothetical protein